MRWKREKKRWPERIKKWHKKFAWVPTEVRDHYVWLEYYERRALEIFFTPFGFEVIWDKHLASD